MKTFPFRNSNVTKDRVTGNRTFEIGVNGPCREADEQVLAVNLDTGRQQVFDFDPELTRELYMVNEGWDGEQDVNIYVNNEFDTVLYVWQTPYQKFTFVNDEWEVEEMY